MVFCNLVPPFRRLLRSLLYRLVEWDERGIPMDITTLNVFQWCKFLKHTGRAVMAAFVAAIVALAAYATFSAALVPGIQSGDLPLQIVYSLLCIIYFGIVSMVVWSYLATMSVDPGGVPPGWHPFDADAIPVDDAGWAEALIREHSATAERQGLRDPADRARTYMERPRWCKKCQAWKPPRSHHCSISRRCVLKMDHYCVWVGNTVGLLNYKHFVLFLGWAFLGCFISAALLLRPCIDFFAQSDPALHPMLAAFLAFVFAAAFTLALLAFLIMHLRLTAINQTTIEAYEKAPIKPWPYDRGTKANFQSVFGREKRYWLVPHTPPDERRRMLSESLDVHLALPALSGDDVETGRVELIGQPSLPMPVIVESEP